jgi:hypothetical protein
MSNLLQILRVYAFELFVPSAVVEFCDKVEAFLQIIGPKLKILANLSFANVT